MWKALNKSRRDVLLQQTSNTGIHVWPSTKGWPFHFAALLWVSTSWHDLQYGIPKPKKKVCWTACGSPSDCLCRLAGDAGFSHCTADSSFHSCTSFAMSFVSNLKALPCLYDDLNNGSFLLTGPLLFYVIYTLWPLSLKVIWIPKTCTWEESGTPEESWPHQWIFYFIFFLLIYFSSIDIKVVTNRTSQNW